MASEARALGEAKRRVEADKAKLERKAARLSADLAALREVKLGQVCGWVFACVCVRVVIYIST